MGVSTFSSSNENHNPHLLSLLAPKPLSMMFFSILTPHPLRQPHHPFSHAVIPPKRCLSSSILPTGYPVHPAKISPTRPLTQQIQSLSLLPLCKSIETVRQVQSQCLCSDMDVTGEAVVRLGENPCSLSCSPQLLLPCRKEQSLYESHKASHL